MKSASAARFGTSRRSTVVNVSDLVVIEDDVVEIEEELFEELGDQSTLITLSTSGLLGRRSPEDEFKVKPGRHDVVARSLETSAYNPVLAITDQGRVLAVKAREVPEMVRGSRGLRYRNVLTCAGEKVVGFSQTVMIRRSR